MKFNFDRDALLKEVLIAQEIISTKNAISVLSNVFIEALSNGTLKIKATDMKINFETSIPVDVSEEGSTTVFCDKIASILSSLPAGEISFIKEDTRVSIKPLTKRASFQLKTIAADKFPEFSSNKDIEFFEIPARALKKMISHTTFSVSDDELRYFMTGVFVEKEENFLKMAATDGRRLAVISVESEELLPNFKAAIVPVKILNIIAKRSPDEGSVFIGISEKNIFFRFGNYEFSSLLIEGQFPNYRRVIPESQRNSLQVNRKDFAEALKRVALLAEQKSRRVYLGISEGNLKISSQETEIGAASEEVECTYQGEDFTIALNYLYLEEPIKVITQENIRIEFSEPMKAITLKAENEDDFFHIIMPMQME